MGGITRRLKAIPKDGLPISNWANANNADLDVVQELRRIIDDEESVSETFASESKQEPARRPKSRYRVQRDFDEIDRSEFRESAFSAMKEYFRKATSEIDAIEGIRGRFADRNPTSFGCTVINQARRPGAAYITVHCSAGGFGLGDIYFSFAENAAENSANGGYRVSADEYEMYLSVAMPMYGNEPDRLTSEQAAEHLWNRFIEQAGIEPV